MFPPSSSVNPFSYSNQIMFKQPNTNEKNLNPTPNPNSPSFFCPFPNSFLTQNNGTLETHFVSQSLENRDTLNTIQEKPLRTQTKRKFDDRENPNPNPNSRKRTGKSDRHSKIYTGKGPRDRRMRLSVPVARKFFDLQDILGFDKASKTIEWLFSQSKAAIAELALNNEPQVSINRSYLLNCENGFEDDFKLGKDSDGELGKVVQVSQANKSRVNSRSRAWERTRQKSKEVGTFEGYPKVFEELGILQSPDQENNFPLQEAGMAENFMGTRSSSVSNSIFDFDKDIWMLGGVDSSNSFMGIFGNLDTMVPLTGNIVQEQIPNSDSFIQFKSPFQ